MNLNEVFYLDVVMQTQLAANELYQDNWKEIPFAKNPTESEFKQILTDHRANYQLGSQSFSGIRIAIANLKANPVVFIFPGGVFHHTAFSLLTFYHKTNIRNWDLNLVWDSEYPHSILTEYQSDIDYIELYDVEVLKVLDKYFKFLYIKEVRTHEGKLVFTFPERENSNDEFEVDQDSNKLRYWHAMSKYPWKFGKNENFKFEKFYFND